MNEYQHPSDYYQPIPQPPQEKLGLAVASMVLGILAILIPYVGLILGIIAIILSAKAMKQYHAGAGKGMAIAGLICGIVGVSVYALIIFFIVILGALFAF